MAPPRFAGPRRFVSIEAARSTVAQNPARRPAYRCNVVAAVAEIGLSYKSAGTDYCVRLRLVDESSLRHGMLTTLFFAAESSHLPTIRSTGDIIVLINVPVRMHAGSLQCLIMKVSGSSFAVFHGTGANHNYPYQTSSPELRLGDEQLRLSQLRSFLQGTPANQGLKELERQLSGIEIGCTFDVVCRIVYVGDHAAGDRVLYVWDGTYVPPSINEVLDGEDPQPTPLCAAEESCLHQERISQIPPFGAVLKVTCCADTKIPSVDGIFWGRLCNVTCEIHQGVWRGHLDSDGYIQVLSPRDASVRERQQMFREWLMSFEDGELISTEARSDILEVDEELVASSLREILADSADVGQFKCLVRVVAVCCSGNPIGSRLTLTDSTSRIFAYLYAEDYKHFCGMEASDPIGEKLCELIGAEPSEEAESSAGSRQVWIGLKFFPLDTDNPWESRVYRVSGTRMKL